MRKTDVRAEVPLLSSCTWRKAILPSASLSTVNWMEGLSIEVLVKGLQVVVTMRPDGKDILATSWACMGSSPGLVSPGLP